MNRMIFINLPVTRPRSLDGLLHRTRLRAEPDFSDDECSCIVVSDDDLRDAADPRPVRRLHRRTGRRRPRRDDGDQLPVRRQHGRRSTIWSPGRWPAAASRGWTRWRTARCTATASPTRTATSGRCCTWPSEAFEAQGAGPRRSRPHRSVRRAAASPVWWAQNASRSAHSAATSVVGLAGTVAGGRLDPGQHRSVAGLGPLQGGDELVTVQRHHPIVVITGQHQGRPGSRRPR